MTWTREVRFSAPYDHRDEKPNGGAHGMDIYFVLAKDDGSGAITARIGTDWMRHPIKHPFQPNMEPVKRERWDKPGIDAGRGRGRYQETLPNPQVVSLHMAAKDEEHDWWRGPDDCDVLPGGRCFGDHGYMVCDAFVVALIEGGHEGAWTWLEETYDAWTTDES